MTFQECLRVLQSRMRRIGPDASYETRRRVELLFRPEGQAQAMELLERECGYGLPGFKRASEADIERVRFAALKLSEGDLHNLREAVNLAKIDFRDLLLSAGFGDFTGYENWLPQKKW